DTQLEAWMIKRVSTSNFYVAAKATSTMMESNKELSLNLSLLVEQISSILENSLEYEWLKATING
ncbi:MAG: hypothetical protein U9O98_03435, partial [Asgard group archaeon]|nr:hypothetical protein [Asgard group archaeon]